MAVPKLTRDYIRSFRDDFGFFCRAVGSPRTVWQLAAMELAARQTVIVAPRQCGKSESLALRALWGAFRRPNQIIMVVSASETAAIRLLATVRKFCTHALLAGAVADETQTRLVLSNGSHVLSVPASEKSIRGWSVDLLIVDECAFVADDILLSAAIPTTAARPEAKVILASTPWGDAGAFFNLAMQGLEESAEHTRTFRWKLLDAPWIHSSVVEAARASLPPLRFRAEYEGEFITSGDAYFSREDILACTADYPLVEVSAGAGMPVKCGLDWGRQQDGHAIALLGVAADFGVNGQPVVVVPWVETSRRPYADQVGTVERLARAWDMVILTETNGVGAYPSEEVHRRVSGFTRVLQQGSTQKSKEDGYGRLLAMFQARRIVIPHHPELLRQLGGISAAATPNGGLRIEARSEGLHDDLPDALALAATLLPKDLDAGTLAEAAEGTEWAVTPSGVRIPLPVTTRFAEPDWGAVYGTNPAGPAVAVIEDPNPWLIAYGNAPGAEVAARLTALRGLQN